MSLQRHYTTPSEEASPLFLIFMVHFENWKIDGHENCEFYVHQNHGHDHEHINEIVSSYQAKLESIYKKIPCHLRKLHIIILLYKLNSITEYIRYKLLSFFYFLQMAVRKLTIFKAVIKICSLGLTCVWFCSWVWVLFNSSTVFWCVALRVSWAARISSRSRFRPSITPLFAFKASVRSSFSCKRLKKSDERCFYLYSNINFYQIFPSDEL